MKDESVIVDVETTGLISAMGAEILHQPYIIEIYILRVNKKLKMIDEFESLVFPPIPLPPIITKITGITPEMLEGQPVFRSCAKPIKRILKGASLFIAHNATFDYDMLDFEFKRAKKTFETPKEFYCTVEQSFGFFGHRPKNIELCSFLRDVKSFSNQHRAKEDVVETFKNYKCLRAIEKGIKSCG